MSIVVYCDECGQNHKSAMKWPDGRSGVVPVAAASLFPMPMMMTTVAVMTIAFSRSAARPGHDQSAMRGRNQHSSRPSCSGRAGAKQPSFVAEQLGGAREVIDNHAQFGLGIVAAQRRHGFGKRGEEPAHFG